MPLAKKFAPTTTARLLWFTALQSTIVSDNRFVPASPANVRGNLKCTIPSPVKLGPSSKLVFSAQCNAGNKVFCAYSRTNPHGHVTVLGDCAVDPTTDVSLSMADNPF